ncbi:MAG: ribosome maturation factor RimP [Desulfobacteraceae bacterium]|nr:MAG: ribosome maturation factor RimP [Desulfobacteraceae bacterium]
MARSNSLSGRHRPAAAPPPAPPADERTVVAKAQALAEALCDAQGLELVHVEFLRDRGGRVLRLFIDKLGGVTLEDCAAVSRELGDVLDVHLPDIGRYHLEVSSPGVNRPLSRERDFERFKGHTARIRTVRPIDGQRTFTGILAGVSGGAVILAKGPGTVALPIEDISKAQLVNYMEKPHADVGNQTRR